MGSSKTPDPITPGESAQAAVGTAAAGEMMSVANQPIDQYGNLVNTMALGPAQMQTQQALMGRAARQGAQQQMDVQSAVDPQAYAQRQMRMNAANQRLGKLYNVDPTAFSYQTPPGTYTVPTTADLPDIGQVQRNAAAIASRLSTAAVNKAGTDPVLKQPNYARDIPYPALAGTPSYY
jgi:hypothetical protein